MKISQVFPSKYVTAADLNGRPYTLTIKTVTLEDMVTHENKKVQKPVCWFVEAQKGFVMNVTNAHIIVALYGDDTTGWEGKRITIYPTQVRAFGQMQDALRVREEIPAQPKPVAQAAQAVQQSDLDDDEDVTDYEDMNATLDPDTGEIRTMASAAAGASLLGGGHDADESLWEPNAPVTAKPNRLSPAQMTRLHVLGGDVYGKNWPAERPQLVSEVTNGAYTSCKELTPDEASLIIKQLEAELKHAKNGVAA